MSEVERNRAFKDRLVKGKALLLPGISNPLGGLIAADIGYEAVYVTGAGVSNMNLGLPDIGMLNLGDVASAVSSIRGVIDLPIVCDADTGFGNAVNVYHTVRTLERAGANAIQLEDQVFPKKCGHFEGKAVIPTSEMVDKIKAAVDGRRDSNFQIIARTDARAIEGFEAAIARAQAFVEAGADITFVEAVTSQEEIAATPKRLSVPQVVNIVHGGKTPPLSFETLDGMGYSIVLYANAALQAAILAMQNVLGELHRTGSLDGVTHLLAGFPERQRLVRKHEYDLLEQRFANGSEG